MNYLGTELDTLREHGIQQHKTPLTNKKLISVRHAEQKLTIKQISIHRDSTYSMKK